MSMSAQQIVNRQDEILKAVSRIRVMRRGTLSQQTYRQRAKRKNGKGAVGPYLLWQGTIKGKRFGQRVSGVEAERVKQGIAQRQFFKALCEEYVDLSCQLAVLEREEAASKEAAKKGLKSRSKRTRKSSASSK
jgi:hypothetical protein